MFTQQSPCVVITGSTRGIGLGLAQAFLALGWCVVISGRQASQVQQSLNQLMQRYGDQYIRGYCCDVTQASELKQLWDFAITHFQQVNIWINNAGSSNSAKALIDISANELQQVINTNILGCMLGSQIALQGMLKQGFGQIFNMEGWGSRGEWSAGMTPYATSKRAVGYFSDALYKETKDTPIKVGTLSPGMVATDLLVGSWVQGEKKNWHKMKWLFMFVIDPVEPVSQYLVKRMVNNTKTHVRIVWMTPLRLFSRFFQPYYWRRNPIKHTDLDQL